MMDFSRVGLAIRFEAEHHAYQRLISYTVFQRYGWPSQWSSMQRQEMMLRLVIRPGHT